MSSYVFSDEQRYAIYTVHGEKCYLHGGPIDLLSMQVDHIIPEHLLEDPAKLAEVLLIYGLPPNFDLNSYSNWLPACGPCNNQKRGRVFDPTPIIQVQLQNAAGKAPKAAELEQAEVHKQTITKAVNTLKRAKAAGKMTPAIIAELRPLVITIDERREPELVGTPLRLAPDMTIEMKMVKGPYGTAMGLFGPGVADAMRCWCGSTAFEGARCVMCGEMGDF